MIRRAMVLAAGLGTRLRQSAHAPPKALTLVGGRSLLDHALDRLERAGVEQIVVNVHHEADAVEAHLKARDNQHAPRYHIADERAELLETGGGTQRALPLLGDEPFFALNVDAFWREEDCCLQALAQHFAPSTMEACLLVANRQQTSGVERDDFAWDDADRTRLSFDPSGGLVYAGAQIVRPQLFARAPAAAVFSFTQIWQSLAQARALWGFAHRGGWMHIGTPAGLAAAQARLAASP